MDGKAKPRHFELMCYARLAQDHISVFWAIRTTRFIACMILIGLCMQTEVRVRIGEFI